jgi:hypothetical protein
MPLRSALPRAHSHADPRHFLVRWALFLQFGCDLEAYIFFLTSNFRVLVFAYIWHRSPKCARPCTACKTRCPSKRKGSSSWRYAGMCACVASTHIRIMSYLFFPPLHNFLHIVNNPQHKPADHSWLDCRITHHQHTYQPWHAAACIHVYSPACASPHSL